MVRTAKYKKAGDLLELNFASGAVRKTARQLYASPPFAVPSGHAARCAPSTGPATVSTRTRALRAFAAAPSGCVLSQVVISRTSHGPPSMAHIPVSTRQSFPPAAPLMPGPPGD